MSLFGELLCSPLIDNGLLDFLHLCIEHGLVGKDVTKCFVVPLFDGFFEVFEFLLEFGHFGTLHYIEVSPS